MDNRKALVCIALALSCLLVASMAYARPAGSSAFLPEYAENPQQVVAQMEANRLVALRYARVFVSEPKAVLTYFRNELSLITLDSSVDVQVYRLDAEGRITSGTVTLKAGTKVFANRAGYPVLEYGTGNPLTSELPAADKAAPKSNPMTQANNAPQAPNQGPPAGNKPVVRNSTPPPAPNTPVVPTEPGSTVVAQTPGAPTPPSGQPPTTKVAGVQMSTGGGAGIGSWMLPVGLAGAVAALAGGGGGGTPAGGGGTPSGDDTGVGSGGGTDPPVAVPEPTSLLALGTGLMALGGIINRRRKHSKTEFSESA